MEIDDCPIKKQEASCNKRLREDLGVRPLPESGNREECEEVMELGPVHPPGPRREATAYPRGEDHAFSKVGKFAHFARISLILSLASFLLSETSFGIWSPESIFL